jgi:hypothetical protein
VIAVIAVIARDRRDRKTKTTEDAEEHRERAGGLLALGFPLSDHQITAITRSPDPNRPLLSGDRGMLLIPKGLAI